MSAETIARLSAWIDAHNAGKDPEAITWGRLAKVSEECGEVIAAYIAATGQNPRKGTHGGMTEVVDELLDVAITALGAVEHITGNRGDSMDMLARKVGHVGARAGVDR